MIKKHGLLALVAIFALGMSAHAEGKSGKSKRKEAMVDQVSGQGYGTAGCGLGSILFGAKPGKIQILSSTTNGIYGNNTFGITSGTSNCDIPEMGHEAAAFIESNYEVVRKDAARGEGETLTALSVILNCQESTLSEEVRSKYDFYFGQDVNSYETVRRMINSGKCSVEG